MWPAEVPELTNEIDLGLVHGLYKTPDSVSGVMHNVLVDICNKAKAQTRLRLVCTQGQGLQAVDRGKR